MTEYNKGFIKSFIFGIVFITILFIGNTVFGATEDLTTYTEVDPNSHFTITATKNDISGFSQAETAYVYYDYGADYFDAIDADFTIYVDSSSGLYGQAGVGFSDNVSERTSWGTDAIWVGGSDRDAGVAWITLFRDYDQANDTYIGSLDTIYYCTISRVAGNDTVNVYIYSDDTRETLLDTLTINGFGTAKWRYSFATAGQNVGQSSRTFIGYIENIDLHLSGTPETTTLDYSKLLAIISLGLFIIVLIDFLRRVLSTN